MLVHPPPPKVKDPFTNDVAGNSVLRSRPREAPPVLPVALSRRPHPMTVVASRPMRPNIPTRVVIWREMMFDFIIKSLYKLDYLASSHPTTPSHATLRVHTFATGETCR